MKKAPDLMIRCFYQSAHDWILEPFVGRAVDKSIYAAHTSLFRFPLLQNFHFDSHKTKKHRI